MILVLSDDKMKKIIITLILASLLSILFFEVQATEVSDSEWQRLLELNAKARETGICEVHNTKMEKKEALIRWGLPPPPGPDEPSYIYRMKNFPHAEEFVEGGCILPIEKKETERKHICQDCQKAEKEWFNTHKIKKKNS